MIDKNIWYMMFWVLLFSPIYFVAISVGIFVVVSFTKLIAVLKNIAIGITKIAENGMVLKIQKRANSAKQADRPRPTPSRPGISKRS